MAPLAPPGQGRLEDSVAAPVTGPVTGGAGGRALDEATGEPHAEIAALQAAAGRPWFRLRLPRGLERRFAADFATSQVARLALAALVSALAFLGLSYDDTALAPGAAWVLTPWRVSIVAGGLVVAASGGLSAWRSWPVPARAWPLLHMLVLQAAALYIIVINCVDPTTLQSVRCSAMMLVLLNAALVARVPLALFGICGSGSIALYGLLMYPRGAATHTIVSTNIALFVISLAFTMAVRWSLDRGIRTTWVMRQLDVHHREELAAGAARLRQLGLRDGLTGLGNRRQLVATLADLDASGGAFCVLAVDIDDFKAYNDTYGHLRGDECLQRVGHALAEVATRWAGIAIRAGGEEFTLVVPDLAGGTGRDVADALCAAVRALDLAHASSRCRDIVTVSVGVTDVARAQVGCTRDLGAALGSADEALYQAKTAGRDRWAASSRTRFEESLPAEDGASPRVTNAVTADGHSPPPDTSHIDDTDEQPRRRVDDPVVDRFWQQTPLMTQRRLSLLGITCAPLAVLDVAVGWRLFPDVAAGVVAGVGAVVGAGSLWLAVALFVPASWRWRLRPVVAIQALLGGVVLWGVHSSAAPLACVPLLALVLLPMFLAFVVGAPVRQVALLSAVLLGGLAAVTYPWQDAHTSIATNVLREDVVACLFVLVGARMLVANRYQEFSHSLREKHLREALTEQAREFTALASSDPLTRLANRRGFEAEMSGLLQAARDAGDGVAMLLLDVDHFKRYNDTAGHPAGDEVLRQIGIALATWAGQEPDASPGGDLPRPLPARWGGEEFAVLLPAHPAASAFARGEEVRSRVEALAIPHPASSVGPDVSVSVGVATLVAAEVLCSDAAARLLARADDALYEAKAAGRNRVAGQLSPPT